MIYSIIPKILLKTCSYLLGARTADVRAEHDLIRALSVHVLLVELAIKDLHISTSAVNVLLMLHRELYHQGLSLIAEGLELAREGVEPGIL